MAFFQRRVYAQQATIGIIISLSRIAPRSHVGRVSTKTPFPFLIGSHGQVFARSDW